MYTPVNPFNRTRSRCSDVLDFSSVSSFILIAPNQPMHVRCCGHRQGTLQSAPHAPSGASRVAAFMSAHSKTPYITPGMDFPSGKGVVRERRGQQLEFSLTVSHLCDQQPIKLHRSLPYSTTHPCCLRHMHAWHARIRQGGVPWYGMVWQRSMEVHHNHGWAGLFGSLAVYPLIHPLAAFFLCFSFD